MESIAVSTAAAASSDEKERRASVVSQRVSAYEQHINQKRRVSDTIQGRRLDELSVVTNSTKASTSTLSTRTKVEEHATADGEVEVEISRSKKSSGAGKKTDETLLGTHVSFADNEECEASCTSNSIDEDEEKLMAAIAAATSRKGKANTGNLLNKMDQRDANIANNAARALQEVERVLFFTDVVDLSAPKETAPIVTLSPAPSSVQDTLVTGPTTGSDIFSPLLEMSAVAMQSVYDSVYKTTVEAYNEVEKTCKEVERALLFTDLSATIQDESVAPTIDPEAELTRVMEKLERTLLFSDLPDDAIKQSKSMPATATTTSLDPHVYAVNSTLSMCSDVHRTLCFTDLQERNSVDFEERQATLMSQVLSNDDNKSSLVTSGDLQRFQDRIEEVRRHLGGHRGDASKRVESTPAITEESEEESFTQDDALVAEEVAEKIVICYTESVDFEERKATLMSQGLSNEENASSKLVTSADLQRFQDRIEEVRSPGVTSKNVKFSFPSDDEEQAAAAVMTEELEESVALEVEAAEKTICYAESVDFEECKATLMSQDNASSELVTPANLQRFRERIQEVNRIRLGGAPHDEKDDVAPADDDEATSFAIAEESEESATQDDASSVEEPSPNVVEKEAEEEAAGGEEEEEVEEVEEEVLQEHASQGSSINIDNANSDEVRLLVEVSVASSKSITEIDALAEADDVTLGKELLERDDAEEEDATEELTESQTEESGPISKTCADSCEVSPVDTAATAVTEGQSVSAATSYSATGSVTEGQSISAATSYSATEDDDVDATPAEEKKGAEKFNMLLAEMKQLETVIDSDLELAQTALSHVPADQ